MHPVVLPAIVTAILISGGAFGFFYAWSITVMRGLDLVGGAAAIAAMQRVNANIMTPWFAIVFFGAPVATAIAAVAAYAADGREAAAWMGAAAALYLLGCFAVTVFANVPMNEALAALDPAALADPDAAWRDYSRRWTAWNHVRTAACAAAFLCAILALRRWPG